MEGNLGTRKGQRTWASGPGPAYPEQGRGPVQQTPGFLAPSSPLRACCGGAKPPEVSREGFWLGGKWGLLRRSPPNGRIYAPGILSPLPRAPESREGRHRGRDITATRVPSISTASPTHTPVPKSTLEAEGQQPPALSLPPRQSLRDLHGSDRWERARTRARTRSRGGVGKVRVRGRGTEGAGNWSAASTPVLQAPGSLEKRKGDPGQRLRRLGRSEGRVLP